MEKDVDGFQESPKLSRGGLEINSIVERKSVRRDELPVSNEMRRVLTYPSKEKRRWRTKQHGGSQVRGES